jgi:uncharacterized protein (DUF2141 family)
MKKLLLLILLGTVLHTHAQTDTTAVRDTIVRGSITIHIKTFRNTRGTANIALYNSSKTFMKKEVFAGAIVNPVTALVKFTFDSIPPGNYAVAVIHDENGDGILNTNDMGIPSEGYAFSNDAKGMFGPPEFKDARFNFSGKNKTLYLNMVYSKAR